jgi:hypothetical protein
MAKELPAPTGEQQAIISDMRLRPQESRKVIAAPGTGKTTTLRHLAETNKASAYYIAYNATTRDEARAVLPQNVKATTAHGLAYAAMRMFDQPKGRIVKRIFPERIISAISFPLIGTGHTELVAATMVLDGLSKFCHSTDREVTIEHFQGLGTAQTQFDPILRAAKEVWQLQNQDSDFPLLHDTYLKQWQLKPWAGQTDRNYIMFDEGQDADPCIVDVVRRMSLPTTWVGDPHQSIYMWRGAINALAQIDCRPFPLMQSWRFGPAVAEIANAIRSGKMHGEGPVFDLVGNVRLNTEVGYNPPPGKRTILTRTNAEWFGIALEFPGIVCVVGGIEETSRLLEAAHQLHSTGRVDRNAPASIARFNNWGQLEIHADAVQDRELIFVKRIVTTYGNELPRRIANLRTRHVDAETHAHLVLSTAHRAKGREWDVVVLGEGFAGPHEDKWHELSQAEREAETNLLFVAASRAKHYLQPCLAAEVLLGAYREKIARVRRDRMGGLFGQPLPLNLRGPLMRVIKDFTDSLPSRGNIQPWAGAGPSSGEAQHASPKTSTTGDVPPIRDPSARLTPPAKPSTTPPLLDPSHRPGGGMSHRDPGTASPSRDAPAAGAGASAFGNFGAGYPGVHANRPGSDGEAPTDQPGALFRGETQAIAKSGTATAPTAARGAPPDTRPMPGSATPAAVERWHSSLGADQFLLGRLLEGASFSDLSAQMRVPEEVLVARGLRVLDSAAARAKLGSRSATIAPENLARMNALAVAINSPVALDLIKPGVDPPASLTSEQDQMTLAG